MSTAETFSPTLAAGPAATAARSARPRKRKTLLAAAPPSLQPLVRFIRWLVPPLLGLIAFVLLWSLVSQVSRGSLPGPVSTWASATDDSAPSSAACTVLVSSGVPDLLSRCHPRKPPPSYSTPSA